MSYWLDDPLQRRDVVTIPTIGIAIALSVLLHIALIWQWKFQLPVTEPRQGHCAAVDGKTRTAARPAVLFVGTGTATTAPVA
jgi:hypothetical protein